MSAERTSRPWLGREETAAGQRPAELRPDLLPVPGQHRANGERNPAYDSTFVFTNDFAALRPDSTVAAYEDGLLRAETRKRHLPGHLLLAAPRRRPWPG